MPSSCRFILIALSAALLGAACAGPSPTLIPTLPAPTGAPPQATFPIFPTQIPDAPPTAVPVALVVCQSGEPISLYRYGDDTRERAGIFEALYDGPIDSAGYEFQPVILDRLPSLADGSAALVDVVVRPGERVVDAATLQVVSLAEGVQLALADGSRYFYSGDQPALAAQVTAQFTLRPGLQWSDGQPLTADDSVFSFELAAHPDTPVGKFVTDRTARYEALDARSLRWVGLPGWRDTGYPLRFWAPFPRHRFGGHSPAQLLSDPEASERPLGWGPFVINEWIRGQRLTLSRNPNYFRAGEGLPIVDRVVFRFGLPPGAILNEIASGDCHLSGDGVDFNGLFDVMAEGQAAGRWQVGWAPGPTFDHLDFGLLPAEDYRRAAGDDVFQDERVRRAMAHCLDRQALIDALFGGLGRPPAAYLPEEHPLFAADRVTQYPYNAQLGGALLDEAGWADADGDGLRARGRQPLTVGLLSGPPGSAYQVQLLQAIQAQLRDHCGVDAQIQSHPTEALYAPWPGGLIFGRRFDLAVFPWRAGAEPPCDLYLGEAIPGDQNPGGSNNTGWSSLEFDLACQAALASFDPAARRAHHADAQAIFTAELPSLPLFFRPRLGAAGTRLAGYRVDPTAQSDLWNLEALRLERP